MLVCVANVVISIVSTCLYYRQLYVLQSAPAFAVQLDAWMQVVVCGVALWLLEVCGLARRSKQAAISISRWAELAAWLSLQNTLEIASIDGLGATNGSLVPVLQQAVIPLTLLASMALLGRHYTPMHWGATGFVVGGIAASYAPAAASDVHRAGGLRWQWALLYLASRIPQTLANVRCEAILLGRPQRQQCHAQEHDQSVASPPSANADAAPSDASLDSGQASACAPPSHGASGTAAREVGGWDALRTVLRAGFWTALFGLAFNSLSSVVLAYAQGAPIGAVWADYRTGAMCLLDRTPNATVARRTGAGTGTGGRGGWAESGSGRSRCADAAGAVAAYALPGVLFTVSEFQVLQHASASTYFLLIALELPLQAAAVSLPMVMGDLASELRPSLWYGIPVLALGLAFWAREEQRQRYTQLRTRPATSSGAEPAPQIASGEAQGRDNTLARPLIQ